MNKINKFVDRNKNYTKVSDVPVELIEKYKGIAPEELIYIYGKI